MTVRNISAEGVRDLFAQHTDAAIFALVSFSHPDIPGVVRVVNDEVPLTHHGVEYQGLPFNLDLASDTEEHIPSLEMTVDNVERLLVEQLRSVPSPADVIIEIVRVKQGQITTELGPLDFQLLDSQINVSTVTLTIGHAVDILNAAATQDIFNPGTAPGLFR